MLRCVTARAGSVLDDGPILPEKNRKAPSSAGGRSAAAMPHAPGQGLRDAHGGKGHDGAMSKPAAGYKPPASPATVAITASSAPPPQPPAQLQPGDAPPLPLFGGPNALDERKLDLWTRAASNSQLWDLQLRTTADNELVHSNTLDLAAVSPFFYKALSSGKVQHIPARPPLPGADPASRLDGAEMRVINVDGIRGSTLRFAVQAIYAREVAINWRSVEEILDAAEKLKIGALRDACALFLGEFLADEPRLAWTLSTKYKCEKVRAAVRKHVVKNFDSIACNKGGAQLFKSIQHKELLGVFNDDKLSIYSESLLLKAVENMMLAERESRGLEGRREEHDWTSLLLALRVEHLEPSQLRSALSSPAVQACPRVISRFATCAINYTNDNIKPDFPERKRRASSWFTWRLDPNLVGGKARSPSFPIPGSRKEWCIVATTNNTELAVFLSVVGEVSEDWRERVTFTIRLTNDAKPTQSIERGLEGEVLDSSRKVWGFKAFKQMSDVRNPKSGFLTSDASIILQVNARSLPMEGAREETSVDKPVSGSAPVVVGEEDDFRG